MEGMRRVDNIENKNIDDDQDHSVYAALNQFFHDYLTKRDMERTLAALSEQVYSIGTGKEEIAITKEEFARLLRAELAQLPDPIYFCITDYVQKERFPNGWDCLCKIQTRISLPNGEQVIYHMRITGSMHRDDKRYVIDTLHASESSRFQDVGEFFPLKFISQGKESLNHETKYELMELIGQIMPGGIVGGYLEEGFPLYVANERLLQMAGYDGYDDFASDIQGLVINSIHEEDRAFVNREMDKILAPGDQYEIQYRMKKKDGSYMWVRDIGRRTVAVDGRNAIISVLTDISQEVQNRICLEREAISDPLTGIYNRKGGEMRISQAMQKTDSYLFFMIDLDDFKQVNDLYGHEQGDKVLCFVANQLAKTFRKTDVICRLGGDEFAVFVAGCTDSVCIQQKVGHLMEAYYNMMSQNYPQVGNTLSAGGIYGRKARSFSELYRLAGEMLYDVKNHGKGEFKLRSLD